MSNTREKIRARMEALGWSTYRLAKQSGVAESTIRAFLDGKQDTTVGKAEAMRRALARGKPGARLDRRRKKSASTTRDSS